MKSGAIGLRSFWIVVLSAACAASLLACSGVPRAERDRQQLELFQKYAGPPVDQFTYLGRYYSWEALSETKLVVWTTFNEAYLITVVPPCTDLPFVQRIGLTSTIHTVSARFDSVLVRHWRCQISEIRPVNYLQMRKDLRAQHQEQKAMPPHNGTDTGKEQGQEDQQGQDQQSHDQPNQNPQSEGDTR